MKLGDFFIGAFCFQMIAQTYEILLYDLQSAKKKFLLIFNKLKFFIEKVSFTEDEISAATTHST